MYGTAHPMARLAGHGVCGDVPFRDILRYAMVKKIIPILFASFFFSFHLALVSYVHSSMLKQFISAETIGFVYIVSSALSLCLVLYAPHLVKRYGNVRYMCGVLGSGAILLFLLGAFNSSWIVVPIFIIYFSLISLMYYGFDVFLERFTKRRSTGNTRGIYLTLGSLAWVGAPTFVGYLTSRSGFSAVYVLAAAIMCLALCIILMREWQYRDSPYTTATLKGMVLALKKNSDVRDIIILQGALQFFFVWMVVYAPLYLHDTMDFGWSTIGTILSIMLLPFIIFQYPVGKMVDRFHNEREIIFAGFFVMSLATLFFANLSVASVLAFALALFLTRVGASIAEVSIESYFFKKADPSDIELMSIFRNMMPVAYFIAPIISIAFLHIGSYRALFMTLGVIMSFAALFSLFLHDIKSSKSNR